MAGPIAGGCDALSVPSASSVATTNTAQLNWQGQGNINTNMTFYMGYIDVLTLSQLQSFNNAGVAVAVYYENSNGLGPQGALGYTPVNAAYFTYAQGVADAQDARNFAATQLGWPTTRPIYYTTDFASTAGNVPAITSYMQGISSQDSYAGLYGNGGTLQGVYNNGYGKYFWQNESLGEYGNGGILSISSGWQVYNGGHLSLNGGNTNIDGDLAFQSSLQTTNDYGQYPYTTPPPPPPPIGSGATNTVIGAYSSYRNPNGLLTIKVPQ